MSSIAGASEDQANGEELIVATDDFKKRLEVCEASRKMLKLELERVRENKDRFQSIAENIPGVVFMYYSDAEGNRSSLYSGPGLADLVGENTAKYIGDDVNRFFGIIPDEDVKAMMEPSLKAEREQSSFEWEYRLKTDLGTYKWVRTISRPIHLDGGRIRWQGILLDIDEIKRAALVQKVHANITEATTTSANLKSFIQITQREMGRLLDTTNYYVALYNEETKLYTFPYYSDKYDKLEKYEPLPLNDSLTDYVRRRGKPLYADQSTFDRLTKKGVISLVGTQTKIWLGAPLRSDKGVIGVVTVQSYDDDSLYTRKDLELLNNVAGHIAIALERKRAEQAQRESELLKTTQELARAIAHEFRQPLTSLKLVIDLLNLKGGKDAINDEKIGKVKNSVERIDSLVNHLLSITHVESKKYAMGLDIVDLDRSSDFEEEE